MEPKQLHFYTQIVSWAVDAAGHEFVFSPLCLTLPSELGGFPSSSPPALCLSIPPSRPPNTVCLYQSFKKGCLCLFTGKPAHTHIPVPQTCAWCVCVCLCLGVAICVNSLLAYVCVCVSGQRHRRRGRGGGTCHCSIQGKQHNFTSQLFRRNTDIKTLFTTTPLLNLLIIPPQICALLHSALIFSQTHAYAHNITLMMSRSWLPSSITSLINLSVPDARTRSFSSADLTVFHGAAEANEEGETTEAAEFICKHGRLQLSPPALSAALSVENCLVCCYGACYVCEYDYLNLELTV